MHQIQCQWLCLVSRHKQTFPNTQPRLGITKELRFVMIQNENKNKHERIQVIDFCNNITNIKQKLK